MSHQLATIEPADPNTAIAQVLDLLVPNTRVLVVGHRGGLLTTAIAHHEGNLELADFSSETDDVGSGRVSERFPGRSFDAIILDDTSAQIVDPVATLRDALALLAPNGRLIFAVANVGHGSTRLALLQGRWDRDGHANGYTRESLLALLRDAELVVEDLRGVVADPLSGEVQVDETELPPHVVEWVRDQPDTYVTHLVAAARPLRAKEAPGVPPELVLAASVQDHRPQDAHSEARVQAGRDALMAKDHILGLQAAVTAAQHRSEMLTVRLEKVRDRLHRQKKVSERQARELRDQIAHLERELARAQTGFVSLARSAARRLRRS